MRNFFFIIVILLYINCLIIPDNHSPVYLVEPNIDLTTKNLITRFSLKESPGIGYKQFFAIVFPKDINKFDLGFERPIPGTINSPKFECKLRYIKGLFSQEVKVSSRLSEEGAYSKIPAETNIMYCQIDDLNFKTFDDEEVKYELKIILKQELQTLNFKSISLLLTTTNNPDKIILDRIHFLNNMGQYKNYKTSKSIQPLVIKDLKIIPVTGYCKTNNCTELYPYDTFNLSIDFKVNKKLLLIRDCIFYIKFPITKIKAESITVTTSSVTTLPEEPIDPLNAPVKYVNDGLQTNNGDTTNVVILNGINENLVPGRRFNFTFNGFSVLDNNTLDTENLEVFINWKNTHSVFSYDYRPIFQISRIKISYPKNNIGLTGINHPEFWDIYSNSAWPLSFNFEVNSSLLYGGYVVIRHTNAQFNINEFNFIASTCDFSRSSFSQIIGERPICYPLRNDLDFKSQGNGTKVYQGSGIFFRLSELVANNLISLTVWGFAESCSTSSLESFTNDPTLPNNRSSYTMFKFTYTIYKGINNWEKDEMRFDNQPILAQSSIISMNSKCWNTMIGDSDLMFDYLMTKSASWKDLLFYKEITEFSLGSMITSDCNDCFLYDITKDYPKAFLYSSQSNTQLGKSYFLLNFSTQLDKSLKNSGNYIPGPWYLENSKWNYIQGKLNIQFSRQWFSSGDANCFLSWANKNNINGIVDYTQTKLVKDPSNNVNNLGNYISVDNNTIDINRMNVLSLTNDEIGLVPNSFPKIMQITSTTNTPILNTDGIYKTGNIWSFFYDGTISSSGSTNKVLTYEAYLFSNCIRNKFPKEENIKSIYAYFDVEIQWLSVTDFHPNGVITKNVRLLKLFPEIGIFNDDLKYNNNDNDTGTNLYYSFLSLQESGICLVEIYGNSLYKINNPNVIDTIIIFLGYSILLESDYSDLSVNYPNVNLNSNLKLKSFNSSYPISKNNDYVRTSSEKLDIYFSKFSYHWFLGSALIISSINNSIDDITNNKSNLFFPFYCPYNNGIKNIGYSNPSIIAYSYNSKGNFNTNSPPYRYIKFGNSIVYKNLFLSDVNIYSYATLAFDGYNSVLNSAANNLYIFNGSKSSLGKDLECKSFIIMTNKNIQKGNSLTFNSSDQNSTAQKTFSNTNQYIYRFLGKEFNTFYSFTLDNNLSIIKNVVDSTTNQMPSTSSLKITGLNRPSIEDMIKIREYNNSQFFSSIKNSNPNNIKQENPLTDLIGFTCIANQSEKNYILSNLIKISYTVQEMNLLKEDFYFLLDYGQEKTGNDAPAFELKPAVIPNMKYYNDDYAGSFYLTFKSVGENFKGIKIRLESRQFTKNTLCGMASKIFETICEISDSSLNSQVCTLPEDSTSGLDINFCCYNIDMKISSKDYTFTLDNYEIQHYSQFNQYFNQILFKNTNPNSIAADSTEKLVDLNLKFDSIQFFNVNQNNGYGKIQIDINLARDLSRNFYVDIYGNFSLFAIKNIIPNCTVFFSTSKKGNLSLVTEDDYFIENCYLNDISNPLNIIKISVKNIVYKCSLQLKKVLKLIMWPIKIQNPRTYPYNDFKIDLRLKDQTTPLPLLDDVAANKKFSLPPLTNESEYRIDGLLKEFQLSDSYNPVKNITFLHYISGFINSMEIEFDITDLKINFKLETNNSINTVSLFLPLNTFEKSITNLICTDLNNNELSCSYSTDGILSISYKEFLSANLFKIKIIGLIISQIEQTIVNALFSFDNVNPENGYRINIITGIKQINLIKFEKNKIVGNLLVENPENSTRIPRSVDSFTTKLIFDPTQDYLNYPITLINPFYLVNFPDYFFLNTQNTKKTDASITIHYIGNKIPKNLHIKNETEFPIYNNLLIIKISENLEITNEIDYLQIDFKNILNPSFLVQAKHISFIKSYIGSESQEIGFINNSNLYNRVASKIDSPIDAFLFYTKGSEYKFESTGLILNFYQTKDSENNNSFILNPGRYFPIIVKVSGVEGTQFSQAITYISLNNPFFQLKENEYDVSMVKNPQDDIYLGAPCGTLPGNYMIKLNSSNTKQFLSLYPIRIDLNISKQGEISIRIKLTEELKTSVIDAKPGFSLYMFYFLSDFSVDDLKIVWTPDDSKNADQSLASISDGLISKANKFGGKSVFGSKDYSNKDEFKFNAKKPNSCFLIKNDVLTISFKNNTAVSKKSEGVPALVSSFTYFNSLTDTSMTDLASIKFVFASPSVPLFLYCVLICKEAAFPSDNVIYEQSIPPSNLIQYFHDYINENTNIDILFSNLVRGWDYKLRCLSSTTDFDYNNRFNNSITYTNFNNYTHQDVIMKTQDNQNSVCVELRFKEKPNYSDSLSILNKCQEYFIRKGFQTNGCLICSDTEKNLPSNFLFSKIQNCGKTLVNKNDTTVVQRLDSSNRNLMSYKEMLDKVRKDYINGVNCDSKEKNYINIIERNNMIMNRQLQEIMMAAGSTSTSTPTTTNSLSNTTTTTASSTETMNSNSNNSTTTGMDMMMNSEQMTQMMSSSGVNSTDNQSSTTPKNTNTQAATDPDENYIPPPGPFYYRYVVCVTQDKKCKTNHVDDKTYIDLLEEFKLNITDPKTLKDEQGNLINFYEGVEKLFIEDSNLMPNLGDIVIKNFINSNTDNIISWTAYYKNYLICKWYVDQNLEKAPSVYDIQNCDNNDENKAAIICGSQVITPYGLKIEIRLKRKLSPGLYNIWMQCSNDLPSPLIYSQVGSVKLVNVQQGEDGGTVISTHELKDKDKIATKPIGIPKLNTKFIGFSFLLLFIILMF